MARCASALRGPRPHARGDTIHTGTGRSLGCLALFRQAAAGRLRPQSADARPREVRPVHSTREAAEQTRATGRGGRGGKGRGRGNRGAAKHGPDAEPGRRVTGAGPRTRSGEAEQAGTVHRADAPPDAGPAGLGLPSAQAEGCSRRRWGDVGRVCGVARCQHRRPAPPRDARRVPGEAVAAAVHPEARRPATAARHRGAGGQGRPARARGGAERHLRDGLPRLLLRVPSRALPARRAGRARLRDQSATGELDPGRRHPVLLRPHQPRLDDAVPGAPDRRPPCAPAGGQMAEGRGHGGGGVDGRAWRGRRRAR